MRQYDVSEESFSKAYNSLQTASSNNDLGVNKTWRHYLNKIRNDVVMNFKTKIDRDIRNKYYKVKSIRRSINAFTHILCLLKLNYQEKVTFFYLFIKNL